MTVSHKPSLTDAVDDAEDGGISVRFGLRRNLQNKHSLNLSNIKRQNTNGKFTGTSGHSYHVNREHSLVKDLSTAPGDDESMETSADRPAPAEPNDRKPSPQRPPEEGFVHFRDIDSERHDSYTDYDADDLAAEASTTSATFVRPTESEMERILSTDDSISTSTLPSVPPPVVDYSSPFRAPSTNCFSF